MLTKAAAVPGLILLLVSANKQITPSHATTALLSLVFFSFFLDVDVDVAATP